ncbi:MAG: hypothetical protein V4529_16430 [Gemmatimonadota bacterium]
MTISSSSYTVGTQTFATKQSGDVINRVTQTGAASVSITEPEGVDMTREGRRFMLGNNAAITGIAPVQTVQTTAAQWGITNPATNTKTAVFDMLGVWLVSGTAGTTGNVVAVAPFTTPAQTSFTAGLAIANCNPLSTATSALVCKATITITAPTAPVWTPIAQSPSAASAAILSLALVNYEIRGRIILPPGSSLALNVYGAAGSTPLFAPIASWYEVESNNS